MARLPQPGGDSGNWGNILNDYLSQTLKADGTLKDSAISTAQIADNSVTGGKIAVGSIPENRLDNAVQTKLNAQAIIADGSITKVKLESAVQTSLGKADTAVQSVPVSSVANKTGAVSLVKADVGLSNVDDTSDTNKPVSTPQQTAIDTAANADSIDGTAITTSAALQTLLNTAATTGKAVRLRPSQSITVTSTITVPDQGGIVCYSAALWQYGAANAMRPRLIAQSGLSGPVLKIGADGVPARGIRLRGFDIDANSISGVTVGIYFNTASTDVENSHRVEDVVVRRVTNGTGIAGRIRTSEFHNVNIFQCLIGAQIGALGAWFDTKWTNGYVALCKNKGVEMAPSGNGVASGFVQFTNLRVERTGQLPNDPNNATTSANWVSTAPGWDITAAIICTWLSCTTDANNGPGIQISVASGSGFGYRISNLLFTNCIFNRDGQGTGTSMDSNSTGVAVNGGSSSGTDHPSSIRFVNCIVMPSVSADDASSSYQAPAYGVTVDHVDFFTWIGRSTGITKGITFGTRDLWQPEILDNYAQLHLTAQAFTTTIPTASAN